MTCCRASRSIDSYILWFLLKDRSGYVVWLKLAKEPRATDTRRDSIYIHTMLWWKRAERSAVLSDISVFLREELRRLKLDSRTKDLSTTVGGETIGVCHIITRLRQNSSKLCLAREVV